MKHFCLYIPKSIILITAWLLLIIVSSPAFSQPSSRKESATAEQIINEAKKYIGTPYRWGGKGPYAFDCAGFVRFIYGKFGYTLAGSCTPQYLSGMPINQDDLQIGDLVFFGGRNASHSIGHVGIVTEIDPNNGFSFIHAARTGVRISHSSEGYYDMRYLCACRLLPEFLKTTIPDSIAMDLYMPDSNDVFQYFTSHEITTQINSQWGVIDTTPVPPDTLTIAMVGNIMPRKTGWKARRNRKTCINFPYDPQQTLLHANVATGHLDGIILNRGSHRGRKHKAQINTQCASQLMYSGFDLLSLANKHNHDMGYLGIDSTMEYLDSFNISYAGVKAYCSTNVIERNGYLYGFCAFGHDAFCHYYRDDREVKTLLQMLRDTVDVLIVSFHSEGIRSINDTMEYQRALQRFAHRAIDLGADVVYGHGYDYVRGLELYNGHIIAYGLGDFCSPDNTMAPVLEASILPDGTFVGGRIITLFKDEIDNKKVLNPMADYIRERTSSNSNLIISTAGIIIPYINQ